MSENIKDEFEKYAYAYFDDLEGHIEMLEQEAELLEDSVKLDEMNDRIVYLKTRVTAGDLWIDNDISSSPDSWKSLETFTEAEAIEKYKEWDQ